MRRLLTESRARHVRRRRSAYTLVELLVVAAIILLLTAMTVAAVNFSVNADRVRATARQIQSMIAGARDRAIYAKDVRGVRLICDPNDNHTVNALQYIGAPGKVSMIGTLTIPVDMSQPSVSNWAPANSTATLSNANDGSYVLATGTNGLFATLRLQGLIKVGSRIQIPFGTGRWYNIGGVSISPPSGFSDQLVLTQSYADFVAPVANPSGNGLSNFNVSRNITDLTYLLELQAQALPDSTPVQLPRGAVIDLDGSQLPSNWVPSSIGFTGGYSNQMDILFSAKGLPVGDVVSFGLGRVHLHVADAGDVVRWKQIAGRSVAAFGPPVIPSDGSVDAKGGPIVKGDHILVSMATRTGNVGVYPVYVTNAAANAGGAVVLTDPYYYAETGVVAGK